MRDVVVLTAPVSTSHVVALCNERRLVVGEEIGRGTLGVVYAARLEQSIPAGKRDGSAGKTSRVETMGSPVAVRVIEPVFARDPEAMQSLRRAARHAALVRHPNVVSVTDFFLVDDDSPCLVMELVAGMSLAELVGRLELVNRRVPVDLGLVAASEVAEGLCAARSARNIDGAMLNMAHHGLNPRQVLLSYNGEVKVTDFGMRPGGGVASGIRQAKTDVRRQLLHMAPEVACGGRGDGRSDVFSLGVMMHEMLRGPRFDPNLDAREMLDLARHGAVQRRVTDPLLPSGVGAIIDRALAVDPRARYPHAGVLAYDVRREAFKLGVGDGRAFLRTLLFEMSEGLEGDTER